MLSKHIKEMVNGGLLCMIHNDPYLQHTPQKHFEYNPPTQSQGWQHV